MLARFAWQCMQLRGAVLPQCKQRFLKRRAETLFRNVDVYKLPPHRAISEMDFELVASIREAWFRNRAGFFHFCVAQGSKENFE